MIKYLAPILIDTIPHASQRYPGTVGDWTIRRGQINGIRVSRLGNPDYELLVALHELIEAYLCLKRGVTQQQVDKFDMAYERGRKPGDDSEPGDDKRAPYYTEHQFATVIERLMADMLEVDWAKYEKAIAAL